MKIWVAPEIERRIESGTLDQSKLPIEIRRFRFLQWKEKEGLLHSKVELNDEFSMILEVKLSGEGPFKKGDPLNLNQIDSTHVFLQKPTIDGNRASFFFVLRQYLGFIVAFDFTPLNPLPVDLETEKGVPFDIKTYAISMQNLEKINAPLQMEKLAKSSWPPSPGYFPNILLKMAGNEDFEKSDEMSSDARKIFTREYFDKRIKEWQVYNMLGERLECIVHSIERHFDNDFRSAIYVIVPQFEGIVSDYLKRNGIEVESKHPRRVDQLVSLLMGRGAILFPKSILDATLKFLREGTFWKYTGRVKNTSEDVNRHGIAHGEFVNFESEELSLKFLIFLDGLCFLLFHDMIVSGKLVE
ncbi:hypothetical protein EH220_08380 [bacterium]|nr:MAG: hypothetical protein EH220_08380 [bacterium]